MRVAIVLIALAVAGPVTAQTWMGPGVSQGDLQRYRIEQQRLRSAEQAAFARQQALNSRLTRLQVEAARQPEPYIPHVQPLPRTSGQPSVAGASQRREAVSEGVGQIDDWLDRDPR
jgi:hypothetical protein